MCVRNIKTLHEVWFLLGIGGEKKEHTAGGYRAFCEKYKKIRLYYLQGVRGGYNIVVSD
jgi:hypothetical protein